MYPTANGYPHVPMLNWVPCLDLNTCYSINYICHLTENNLMGNLRQTSNVNRNGMQKAINFKSTKLGETCNDRFKVADS